MSCLEFIACLELRGSVFLLLLKFRETNFSTAIFLGVEEPLPSDMKADNHSIECVAGYPYPVLLGASEQLRQMWLKSIPPGVFAINAVIAFFQLQKMVMDICKFIKHISQAFILGMITYLIFIGSQGFTSYQSLTLEQWVGRHTALRRCCSCLPTGKK